MRDKSRKTQTAIKVIFAFYKSKSTRRDQTRLTILATYVNTNSEDLMSDTEDPLSQMNEALDELLETARSLAQLTTEGVDDEQIIPLQEKQETLVARVIQLDSALQMGCNDSQGQYDLRLARVQEKLTEFQTLNREFVEQMRRNKNIILFDADEALEESKKRLHKRSGKKK